MILPAPPLVLRKRPARAGRGRSEPSPPPPPPPVAAVVQVRQVGESSDAVWIFDTDVASIAPGGTAGLHIDGLTLRGDFELLGGGFVLVSYHEFVPFGVAWHVVPASCHITFVNGAVLNAQDGTVIQWPPPAVAPTLVSAAFDDVEPAVVMSFDRAVNIDAMNVGEIVVQDGTVTMLQYAGVSGELIDASTVKVVLEANASTEATEQLLDASAGNGIVAADGLAPWEGVSSLGLPFP